MAAARIYRSLFPVLLVSARTSPSLRSKCAPQDDYYIAVVRVSRMEPGRMYMGRVRTGEADVAHMGRGTLRHHVHE